jgi:hypothetical protein
MIAVKVGGSLVYPQRVEYSAGVSILFLFPGASRIGSILETVKIKCAECNTPIFEIVSGSMVVKSKHHSSRHTTSIPIRRLLRFVGDETNTNIL